MATIGFLALSGYSQNAKDSAIKANVRSVVSAISSESSLTGNSPRYYVIHDTGAALTGAFIFVDGTQTVLTGGTWDAAGTNYSAGNPDYAKLKLNADKFKVASLVESVSEAFAAYDPSGALSVGAVDYSSSVNATGRKRSSSWFQVAGTNPTTKVITVLGNYPGTSLSGSVAGLVKDPASTGPLVDAGTSGTPPGASPSGGGASRYPGCDTNDVPLANGQVWAMCNVGATNAWTGGIAITDCSGSATDCDASIRNTLGSYFQWGRNDDVTAAGTPTSTKAVAGTLAGGVGHSNFITNGTTPYDWIATQNDNLWGGGSTSLGSGTFTGQTSGNQTAMTGPCAAGYHVPTQAEWWSAISTLNPILTNTTNWQNDTTLVSTLKLPLAGTRYLSSAAYLNQGTNGYYWTSSPSGTSGYGIALSATQVYPGGNSFRANGLSVRCLKN